MNRLIKSIPAENGELYVTWRDGGFRNYQLGAYTKAADRVKTTK